MYYFQIKHLEDEQPAEKMEKLVDKTVFKEYLIILLVYMLIHYLETILKIICKGYLNK